MKKGARGSPGALCFDRSGWCRAERAYFISSIAALAFSLARPEFPTLQAVSASLIRDAAFLKSAEDVLAPARVRGAWIC